MKKVEPIDDEDMPDEIDFSGAIRGKYAGRFSADAIVVVLEPDVTEVFPNSDAVNAALRMVMRAGVLAAGRVTAKNRQVG